MIADDNAAEKFRTRAEIDMPPERRHARFGATMTERDLLENQAIRADADSRMNHDAIGMRQDQPAAESAVERDIRPADEAPESVLQDPPFFQRSGPPPRLGEALIAADAAQQSPAGIPVSLAALAVPVGFGGRDVVRIHSGMVPGRLDRMLSAVAPFATESSCPMNRLRVLVIAEACNPGWSSVPLVGYHFARALAEHPALDVTVVTQVRNRPNLENDPIQGHAEVAYLDNEWLAAPFHRLGKLLRGGSGVSWTTGTAVGWPSYVAFEHQLYDRYARDLQQGRFDLIHRVTPLTPTYPSPLAAMTTVPMIAGPLNGGLPWPKQYPNLRRREREWLVPLRHAYRALPYYRQTYRHLAGVIAGSRHTATEVPRTFRGARYELPENGIDPTRFPIAAGWPEPTDGFTIASVGRLVPYKGFDLLLEAVAGSQELRGCRVVIVGDGPERGRLEQYAQAEGLTSVEFTGWRAHPEVARIIAGAQLFAFPSLREFGGAVALEAMAAGVVPIVVDYGGPGELVGDAGVRLPMRPRAELVLSLRAALERLKRDPTECRRLGALAVARVESEFTWSAKAERLVGIYHDVLSRPRR